MLFHQKELIIVYKVIEHTQFAFLDFNQPLGLNMNPQNRWIKIADRIPWKHFEKKYAKLFPSNIGNVAKPLRMALGSLIIQTKYGFSDKELVEQLTENPYYQYLIGLPGYQQSAPFEASTLVSFRKRMSADMLMEINEYLLESTSQKDVEYIVEKKEKKKEQDDKEESEKIMPDDNE